MNLTRAINFMATLILPTILVALGKLSYTEMIDNMNMKIVLEMFYGLFIGFYVYYIFQYSSQLCKNKVIHISYLIGILFPVLIHIIAQFSSRILAGYSLYNSMSAFFIIAVVQIVCFIKQIYYKRKEVLS